MAFSQLITPITKIAAEVLDRVVPDNASEEERHRFKMELEAQLFRHDWSAIEAQFQDRQGARNLAAQDIMNGPGVAKLLAGVNRPIWSLTALVGFMWAWIGGHEIPAPVENILLTVVYFYFGGRTLEKATNMISNRIGEKK